MSDCGNILVWYIKLLIDCGYCKILFEPFWFAQNMMAIYLFIWLNLYVENTVLQSLQSVLRSEKKTIKLWKGKKKERFLTGRFWRRKVLTR